MPLKEWKMQTFFYSFSTALSHDKAIILQSHRAKGSSRATSPHHTWHLSGSSCLFCFPSSSFLQALDTNRIFWSGKCAHSKHPGWKGFSPRNSCAFQAWVPWISMFPSFFFHKSPPRLILNLIPEGWTNASHPFPHTLLPNGSWELYFALGRTASLVLACPESRAQHKHLSLLLQATLLQDHSLCIS